MLALAMAFPLAGCHSSAQAALQAPGSDTGNPADANLATVPLQGNGQQNEAYTQAQTYQNGQPSAQTNQAPAQSYPQQQAYQDQQSYPAQQQQAYQDQNDPNGQYADDDTYYNQGADALDEVVADAPPPELPTYDQPVAPGPDYIWTPGYWYYAPTGYYWVPGAWVYPPYVGALWTPGYWGWYGGHYRYRRGYWGPHVGFYGGINYGFGYIGFGYQGGYWNNNHFYYNQICNRVPPRSVYVYQRNITVVNRTYINNTRVAFYGGRGGINRAPAPQERYAYREQHVRPMTQQVNLRQEAQQNRNNFYSANRGRPQQAAVSRPLQADRGFQRPASNAVNPQWQQRQQMQQQRQQQVQNQNRVTPVPQNMNPQINRGGFNNGFNQNGRAVPQGQQQQPNVNRGGFDQQRQQADQQRMQQQQQQRAQEMQQRQQNQQQQLQQRQQQIQQQQQQRQQAEQQRAQQQNQQRQQEMQNQQRAQQMQERQQQQMQQRQQQQQQQMQQRQAEQQQRMQQQQMQRQQQMQQRQQQQMQRQQAPRPQGGGGEHGGGHGNGR